MWLLGPVFWDGTTGWTSKQSTSQCETHSEKTISKTAADATAGDNREVFQAGAGKREPVRGGSWQDCTWKKMLLCSFWRGVLAQSTEVYM